MPNARLEEALKGTGVAWHGFHALRHALGTRLHNSGTKLETIGRLLRHGSGSEVTLKHYVEVSEETAVNALAALPKKSKRK